LPNISISEKNNQIESIETTITDTIDLTKSIEKLEIIDADTNIKELYENRIKNREKQDQILFEKLDKLHKDDNFISNLVVNENKTSLQNSEKKDIECDQLNNRKKGFFTMMYDFVNNKEWLEKTDVCCWWCCHQFDNVPLGLPIDYMSNIDKFRVKGVYCSFACMKSHHDDQGISKKYLIKYLYRKLTGDYSNIDLEKAPPRCTLKMFGGELTIDEFRNSTNENKIYKMINYPMFISKDYVEEVDLEHIKHVNSKVFKDMKINKMINNNSDKITEAKLRLSEIEKSTISFGNTIDKFIKIS
jgi:hypothetical protein